MNIKSLLAQKRTKIILTCLYFATALLLLLLTWMRKIAIGSLVGTCFLMLGHLLWMYLRDKGGPQ